ncbi:bifunctional 4-hydroxy-2-oxoglutarate aldolase/2-dehydro-3-deoxy-phosphogluconate aldolase [Lactobacillus sp. ESL0684]|uniref:bifunctional 4-hydroxy-2-oxoglutarate aldolase/2-dehydro-3-deoxy-phosphogluconate aldolase n=1 Tax=Lactobacillus sp. ESL0684 TaxID=2983213 RepID=UPI0023F96701|nr:bifunctional 4-hydroxy-2-oxoglutarate aldolase/2-dehydro-3-deoxy-phosphogluconate aldolase [Lactobacillus sp. ESL0684]WEV43608.1 bifunctional 4-hydroxy-2-oxoglutarate aldolase/2-dehydro-3-deoxy-phosphogluconate aldolase [Lactobacillus sp. ESL0684]
MQKNETLSAVKDAGIVAVVRGNSKKEAYQTAVACIKGGVKAIELTFTAPQADEIIKQLHNEYKDDPTVVIGAGTVLDAVTARIAIMAGAKFIVAPSFDREVALLCNEYQVPYMPGCMTVTEIQTAMRYGSEIVKIFPGSALGQGFVKAVKAPLPQANVMPTGGVNLTNMHEWFEAGVVVVGAGSNLTAAAAQGDYDAVTKQAQAYHEEFLRIQEKRVS